MNETKTKTTLITTREARGRVSAGGIELAFGYWAGRGAPVVALHGLTATYLTFLGVAQALAGRRPLLALDLRGRGDSDKPEGPYGFPQHARDVAASMRTMALGPSIVVGHSMGAFVAATLAEQNPELVSALVFIDGGYVPELSAGVDASQGAMNAALALRIEQLRRTYPTREAYREHWRAQPHFPSKEWNALIEAFLDYEVGGAGPVQPKASEAAVRADIAAAVVREPIIERLRALRVPVVMVRADNGFVPGAPPLYPASSADQIRTLVPHIQDHLIEETTHYTLVLAPRGSEQIANLICQVADQVAPLKARE